MRKRLVHRDHESAMAKADRPSDPAPSSDPELSTSRPRIREVLPQAWLDQLLLATVDLPLADGEVAVVEAMLESLASILSLHSVGARLVRFGPEGSEIPTIFARSVAGAPERGPSAGGARLFPAHRAEYIAAIAGSLAGSALHVASDSDDFEPHGSAAVHLIDRAAVILSRAMAKARSASVSATAAKRTARALERRMIQADKLATFGQLAAGVVHELNNPLTSIVAYSEYLIRKAVPSQASYDADDVERLRRIQESANRMLRFTRELVGYARPSSGAAGPVALWRVIDQAVAFCEHVLSAAGVVVERQYGAEPSIVQGVSEQLVQVFVNLLTNACQAARKDHGRIVITTSRMNEPQPRVVVVVEDNGCGIPSENLGQVFLPFFTTRRETHGTGLGLSIIKNIVESHDGTISVESRVDNGTRFVIELPPHNPDEG